MEAGSTTALTTNLDGPSSSSVPILPLLTEKKTKKLKKQQQHDNNLNKGGQCSTVSCSNQTVNMTTSSSLGHIVCGDKGITVTEMRTEFQNSRQPEGDDALNTDVRITHSGGHHIYGKKSIDITSFPSGEFSSSLKINLQNDVTSSGSSSTTGSKSNIYCANLVHGNQALSTTISSADALGTIDDTGQETSVDSSTSMLPHEVRSDSGFIIRKWSLRNYDVGIAGASQKVESTNLKNYHEHTQLYDNSSDLSKKTKSSLYNVDNIFENSESRNSVKQSHQKSRKKGNYFRTKKASKREETEVETIQLLTVLPRKPSLPALLVEPPPAERPRSSSVTERTFLEVVATARKDSDDSISSLSSTKTYIFMKEPSNIEETTSTLARGLKTAVATGRQKESSEQSFSKQQPFKFQSISVPVISVSNDDTHTTAGPPKRENASTTAEVQNSCLHSVVVGCQQGTSKPCRQSGPESFGESALPLPDRNEPLDMLSFPDTPDVSAAATASQTPTYFLSPDLRSRRTTYFMATSATCPQGSATKSTRNEVATMLRCSALLDGEAVKPPDPSIHRLLEETSGHIEISENPLNQQQSVELPSPYSNVAVARMQQLSSRPRRQVKGVRLNGREMLSATWGQLSALGIRRSSSICSEPSINTRRKHRYEMLLMQHNKNKTTRRKSDAKLKGTSVQGSQSQQHQQLKQPLSSRLTRRSISKTQELTQIKVTQDASLSNPVDVNNELRAKNSRTIVSTQTSQSSMRAMKSSPITKCIKTSFPFSPPLGPNHTEPQTSQPLSVDTPDFSGALKTYSPVALYLFQSDCILRAMLTQITPTDQEREAKRVTFNALASFLQAWQGNRIQVYVAGSTAYDVDSTSSDLDIVVTTNDQDHLKVLQNLCEKIRITKERCAGDPSILWPLQSVEMQVVRNARVPILLLKLPDGVVCDISVNTDNSISHTEFFKAILRERDHLRAFMRLIKYWVKVRHLPAMRDGGLPSIVWMLLCVFLCRQCEVCYSSSGMALAKTISPPSSPSLSQATNDYSHKEDVVASLSSAETSKHFDRTANSCYPESPKDQNSNILTIGRFVSSYTRWLWSLNSCSRQIPPIAPLTTLLGEFFARLRSRKELTCTISIAAGLIIPKDLEDVAKRILSPPAHGGVWDELLSVEDPAGFDRNFFPNGLLVEPQILLERKLEAPNVLPNGTTSLNFKDLASKISAATWLVYQYELRRSDLIIKEYIYTVGNSINKEANKIVRDDSHPSQSRQLEDHLGGLADMFMNLFKENPESRYRVPASLPIPTERGDECCDFYLVLLHGKLMILKIAKICADQEGWWSTEFLSRRDIRSVLHGRPFFCVVIPDPTKSLDLTSITGTTHRRWLICSSPYMANIRFHAADSDASLIDLDDLDALPDVYRPPLVDNNGSNRSHTTSPLIPNDRRNSKWNTLSNHAEGSNSQHSFPEYEHNTTLPNSMMVDDDIILFNPCNLVCQLRAIKLTDYNSEVYELPLAEVKIIQGMLGLAKEAPYWHADVQGYGAGRSVTMYGANLQPPISVCKHCSQLGVVEFPNDLGYPHRPYDWLTRALESHEDEDSMMNGKGPTRPTETEMQNGLETFLSQRLGEDIKVAVWGTCYPPPPPSTPPAATLQPILRLARQEFNRLLPRLSQDPSRPNLDISGVHFPYIKSPNVKSPQLRPTSSDNNNPRFHSTHNALRSPQSPKSDLRQPQRWAAKGTMGDIGVGESSTSFSQPPQLPQPSSSASYHPIPDHAQRQRHPLYDRHINPAPSFPQAPPIAQMATGLASPINQTVQQLNVVPQFLMTNFSFPTSTSAPPLPRAAYPQYSTSVVVPGSPTFTSPTQNLSAPTNPVGAEVVFVAKGQPFNHSLGQCFSFAAVIGLPLTVQQVMQPSTASSITTATGMMQPNTPIISRALVVPQRLSDAPSSSHPNGASFAPVPIATSPNVMQISDQHQQKTGHQITPPPPIDHHRQTSKTWIPTTTFPMAQSTPFLSGTPQFVPYTHISPNIMLQLQSQQMMLSNDIQTDAERRNSLAGDEQPSFPRLAEPQQQKLIPPAPSMSNESFYEERIRFSPSKSRGASMRVDYEQPAMASQPKGVASVRPIMQPPASMKRDETLKLQQTQHNYPRIGPDLILQNQKAVASRSTEETSHHQDNIFRDEGIRVLSSNSPVNRYADDENIRSRHQHRIFNQQVPRQTNAPDSSPGAPCTPVAMEAVLESARLSFPRSPGETFDKPAPATSPLTSSGSGASSFTSVRVPNRKRQDIPRYVPPGQRVSHQSSSSSIDGATDGSPAFGQSGTLNSSPNYTRRTSCDDTKREVQLQAVQHHLATLDPTDDHKEEDDKSSKQRRRSGETTPCRPLDDSDFEGRNNDDGNGGGPSGSCQHMGSSHRNQHYLLGSAHRASTEKGSSTGSSRSANMGRRTNGKGEQLTVFSDDSTVAETVTIGDLVIPNADESLKVHTVCSSNLCEESFFFQAQHTAMSSAASEVRQYHPTSARRSRVTGEPVRSDPPYPTQSFDHRCRPPKSWNRYRHFRLSNSNPHRQREDIILDPFNKSMTTETPTGTEVSTISQQHDHQSEEDHLESPSLIFCLEDDGLSDEQLEVRSTTAQTSDSLSKWSVQNDASSRQSEQRSDSVHPLECHVVNNHSIQSYDIFSSSLFQVDSQMNPHHLSECPPPESSSLSITRSSSPTEHLSVTLYGTSTDKLVDSTSSYKEQSPHANTMAMVVPHPVSLTSKDAQVWPSFSKSKLNRELNRSCMSSQSEGSFSQRSSTSGQQPFLRQLDCRKDQSQHASWKNYHHPQHHHRRRNNNNNSRTQKRHSDWSHQGQHLAAAVSGFDFRGNHMNEHWIDQHKKRYRNIDYHHQESIGYPRTNQSGAYGEPLIYSYYYYDNSTAQWKTRKSRQQANNDFSDLNGFEHQLQGGGSTYCRETHTSRWYNNNKNSPKNQNDDQNFSQARKMNSDDDADADQRSSGGYADRTNNINMNHYSKRQHRSLRHRLASESTQDTGASPRDTSPHNTDVMSPRGTKTNSRTNSVSNKTLRSTPAQAAPLSSTSQQPRRAMILPNCHSKGAARMWQVALNRLNRPV